MKISVNELCHGLDDTETGLRTIIYNTLADNFLSAVIEYEDFCF